jgi:hypothetical protein
MTNSHSKFARFQYTSPADIGIENYDPTAGKMAVHQELLCCWTFRHSRSNYRDTPAVEKQYCEAMETVCLQGNHNYISRRMKVKADEFSIRIGKWELKRDCYDAAYTKFKSLTWDNNGLLPNAKRVKFIIGSCHSRGDDDSEHLNSGMGLRFTHAWVEIHTTINDEPYVLVIDPSNGQTQYSSQETFYRTACVVHTHDFTKTIIGNFLKLFINWQKSDARTLSYTRNQILDLDAALAICDKKDKEMDYKFYANEIVEVVGRSVLACC